MSSAGLMRYYDAEGSAIQLSPKTVVSIGLVTGVSVLMLGYYFGSWP
ncbi:MAG: preprotein translocase subunit Sec61beta [Methanosarcinales archaeon]|nr:preprotein translocase subunit Sec61beta [Methanosarcinales archaeon]